MLCSFLVVDLFVCFLQLKIVYYKYLVYKYIVVGVRLCILYTCCSGTQHEMICSPLEEIPRLALSTSQLKAYRTYKKWNVLSHMALLGTATTT